MQKHAYISKCKINKIHLLRIPINTNCVSKNTLDTHSFLTVEMHISKEEEWLFEIRTLSTPRFCQVDSFRTALPPCLSVSFRKSEKCSIGRK